MLGVRAWIALSMKIKLESAQTAAAKIWAMTKGKISARDADWSWIRNIFVLYSKTKVIRQ